jgi:hypothetical protein
MAQRIILEPHNQDLGAPDTLRGILLNYKWRSLLIALLSGYYSEFVDKAELTSDEATTLQNVANLIEDIQD